MLPFVKVDGTCPPCGRLAKLPPIEGFPVRVCGGKLMGCPLTKLAESELKASVERLFDEGGSADQGDSTTWGGQGTGTMVVKGVKIIAAEDVTAKKPKHPSKKRQAVTDASGSSNSPKKLRGNYGTSSGVATSGKSPSVLIELLASSMLNVEGGVTAMATLPMVTSSVSAIPEHKSGTLVDSITGMNLRTIGASQRFFISLDSSYHSGANASGAEDDSIIRSAAVPPVMTNAVVTSHAATAPSVLETDKIFQWALGSWMLRPCTKFLFHDGILSTVLVRGKGWSLSEQADLLKARDDEIENLKAWLLLKETKAAKAAHLCCQVSAAEAIEKIHTNEIDSLKQRNVALENETESLDGKVAELQSLVSTKDLELKDLNVAVHALETTCSGLYDQVSGYERLKEQIEEFQDVQINIVNDKEYLSALGVAISHSTKKGMQDGLSANINHDFPLLAELKSHKNASVKDIMNFLRLEGPLADAPGMNDLVKRIKENVAAKRSAFIGTDDPDNAQGNGQGNVVSFPTVKFEKEELDTTPKRMPISVGVTAFVPYVSEKGVSSLLDLIVVRCAKLVNAILLRAPVFFVFTYGTYLIENVLKPLVNSLPSGFVRISPAPEPSVQDDPFVNKVYSSESSSSTSMAVSGSSSSRCSTMKSARICPLTNTLGL
nr:hypothetical protein [Tanacetum cinerariifolium]